MSTKRLGGEGCNVDKAGNVSDAEFHDELWASIPQEVKNRRKMANVREAMKSTGISFEVAMSLYFSTED